VTAPAGLLAFATLLICWNLNLRAEPTSGDGLRNWTSVDGRQMQAKLVGVEGDTAVFQLANGQSAKVQLAKLSQADQDFVKSSAPVPVAAKSQRVPIEKRTWPQVVEVSTKAINVTPVTEDPVQKKYEYRTESFNFTAQDKLAGSVMMEVARTFEATRTLVNALPWGIDPKPPQDLGYFQARLYVNMAAYHHDGGPLNSGGVYFSGDRVFRVPFESLGLVMRGKTWFKKQDYTNDTLVHEITHQMMHDFLPFMPIWMTEGTAEYTNMLPYNAGRFQAASHERGIKDYIKRNETMGGLSMADVGSVDELMRITSQGWHAKADGGGKQQHRLYFASCLLVYYFCHLDGDGKGTRFLKFMDKMADARDAWNVFFANPEVHREDNGSFTYPRSLKLPGAKRDGSYGLEQLDILLDGRGPSQMDADFRAGFKKIGVKM